MSTSPIHSPYILVGGGMTADAAVDGIRSVDADGPVTLITAEPHPPYNRPPLSKMLWKGAPERVIWRKTEEKGVDLVTDTSVSAIRPDTRTIETSRGQSYTYDALLLATGGSARRLSFRHPRLQYYRTLDDYRRLADRATGGAHIAVIGAGFIGTEIASCLLEKKCRITLIFPEAGIGARVFPQSLRDRLHRDFEEAGVQIRAGCSVDQVSGSADQPVLQVSDGSECRCDAAVAGIGIEPETGLAEAAGLPVDDGICVDERFRTSDPAIFAAGDVASLPHPATGERVRIEHEDHALRSGRCAGQNMAGADTPYNHTPIFYSGFLSHFYEAVGHLDASLRMIEDWKDGPGSEGAVFYLRDDVVAGVLLWNAGGLADRAKTLLGQSANIEELKTWRERHASQG